MLHAVRRALFGDWQIKFAGLLIAFVLWVYVRNEQLMQLTLDVPLTVKPPASWTFGRRPPAMVEIRILAHRDLISRLDLDTVRALVDLSEAAELPATLRLEPRHVVRPDGVGVLRIHPESLELEPARVPAKKRGKSRR